jgi:hypothetical protein
MHPRQLPLCKKSGQSLSLKEGPCSAIQTGYNKGF